jgi:hypothetical protein
MTDTSLTEAAPDNSHKKRRPVLRGWNSARSIAFAALAIAVIAAAVAIVAWLRPAHPSFSSQQSAGAKANVCAAYTTVHKAVFVKHPKPHPGDVVAEDRVASNERLALLGGGAYLRETTAAEPAAPADLVKAVNSMGITLEQMGLEYVAGANKSVWEPLRKDLGSETGQINKICGSNNNTNKK